MLRFAPSPTGDMHIGNLRAAVFNYIVSRQLKRDFLIRIEDTDGERNIEGKENAIFELLDIFGVKHEHEQLQSTHLARHRAVAEQLIKSGHAFKCYCTPEEITAKRGLSSESSIAYRYDGSCANKKLNDDSKPFVVRLLKPADSVVVTDIIKGVSTFTSDEIDSFILLRSDGTPTYNFACAVDDIDAGVSMIIRGEDHQSNTPKQISIQRALNDSYKIEYAHLPIIINEDGKKMSKRDSASSIKWLLSEGFVPGAIANYLIWMGNNTPTEIFTMDEAMTWFDLSKISSSAARFDMDKLKFINRTHLRKMEISSLEKILGVEGKGYSSLIELFVKDSNTLKELKDKIELVFTKVDVSKEYTEAFEKIQELTKTAPALGSFEDYKNYLIEKTGLKGKALFKPLRIFMSGSEHGAEMEDLYNATKKFLKNK